MKHTDKPKLTGIYKINGLYLSSVQIMKIKEEPMQHSKLKTERHDVQMHVLELDIFDTKDVIATIGSQFLHL